VRDAIFARLVARGRLRVGEVLVSAIRVGKLDADAEIDGRSFVLHRAQADFYGGRLNGELNASLASTPSYSFRGHVDRIDLGLLSSATDPLSGRLAGLAVGDLSLTAHGIGRQPLTASLEGEGVLRLRNVTVRGLDLGSDRLASDRGSARASLTRTIETDQGASETRYSSAAAAFHVAGGQVRIDQLLLVGRDEQLEIDGTVDFARQMNLRARSTPRDASRPSEVESQEAEADTWIVSGSLDAPQVLMQTSVAGARPLPAGARR
jgi:hypothetical protein